MLELILLLLLFIAVGVATIEFRAGKLVKIQRASLDELKGIRHCLAAMHEGYAKQLEDAAVNPPPLPSRDREAIKR